MTAPVEQTLNVTVAQIEDALLAGQTVPDFAREWSEPPTNVLAVFRRLQREGRIPMNGPSQVSKAPAAPVAGQRSLTSVPQALPAAQSAPLSVDTLVNAAARSTSKRTQALGVKLADLASVVRQRLNEERVAAEKAEQVKREREAAASEIARLESMLREARERVKPLNRVRQGTHKTVTPKSQAASSANAARNNEPGEFPCRKCGRVCASVGGRGRHEASCKSGAVA